MFPLVSHFCCIFFGGTLPETNSSHPETNSSHLKIGHPNRKVVFQPSIFRGYVSFREGITSNFTYYRTRRGVEPSAQQSDGAHRSVMFPTRVFLVANLKGNDKSVFFVDVYLYPGSQPPF